MAGFDYDVARVALGVPTGYRVEALFAVGKPGRVQELEEKMREREMPSDRKPIAEFAFEGDFPSVD